MVAGAKIYSPYFPAAVGALLVMVSLIMLKITLNGETAKQVKQLAAKELGQGYNYNVNSLKIVRNSKVKFVSATVMAYNKNEIRVIPVKLEEK